MKVAVDSQVFRNDAFICYSDEDKDFAIRLEKALRRHKPLRSLGLDTASLNVFRDTPDLANTEYAQIIHQQLESSHKLIVICSPDSKTSHIVNERIRRFAVANDAQNIIPVVVNRNPNSGFEMEPDNLQDFPPALCEVRDLGIIPRYDGFDLRKNDVENGSYAPAWYTLLSCIYEINRSEIAREEKRKQFIHYRRKVAAILNGVLLAFIILSGTIMWQQVNSDRIARTERATQIYNLSRISSQENDFLKSLHLLSEAIALQPREELRNTLFEAVERYQPASRLTYIVQHEGEILGAQLNNRQSRILTWSDDNTARVWDFNNGQQVSKSLQHDDAVFGARYSSDESRILSWSADGTAKVWDAKSSQQIGSTLDHGAGIVGAAFNNREDRIVTWGEDFVLKIWNAETGRQIGKRAEHDGWINGILFSDDDSRFISWSDDSTARIWDPATGKKIGRGLFHPAEVNGARFNKSKRQLLTWSSDGSLLLWNIKTGKARRLHIEHGGEVIGAVYNKEESRILSWGRDNTARLWNIETGRGVFSPMRHEGWVFGAVFNPFETRILTWSFDNSARLWDAQTGKQLGMAMKHSSGPNGNDAGIFGAAFNSSGGRVLTWGDDNTARIWATKTGRQIGAPLQHANKAGQNREVKGAVSNDEMTQIFTWSSDSTGRFWVSPIQKSKPAKAEIPRSDLDFPLNYYKLQIRSITGTYLDSLTTEVHAIAPVDWQIMNEEYQRIAQEHYLKCKYPEANLWRKLYPEDAEKIRPLP